MVVDGSIVVATMMTCTLSADHRVLDGATGARFLSTFKSLIEQPSLLIDHPVEGRETSPKPCPNMTERGVEIATEKTTTLVWTPVPARFSFSKLVSEGLNREISFENGY